MKDFKNNLYPVWANENEKKELQEGLIYTDLNKPAEPVAKDFSNYRYPNENEVLNINVWNRKK